MLIKNSICLGDSVSSLWWKTVFLWYPLCNLTMEAETEFNQFNSWIAVRSAMSYNNWMCSSFPITLLRVYFCVRDQSTKAKKQMHICLLCGSTVCWPGTGQGSKTKAVNAHIKAHCRWQRPDTEVGTTYWKSSQRTQCFNTYVQTLKGLMCHNDENRSIFLQEYSYTSHKRIILHSMFWSVLLLGTDRFKKMFLFKGRITWSFCR